MGKKVSQTSLKITKKEKKEFNSLIRLLRPKVYITDSSSFKRLVQDLTGNGASNAITTTTSSLPPRRKHIVVVEEDIPVVDIDDQEDHGGPEGSIDVSIDVSVDDSSDLCNQGFMSDQEFNQLCYQICSDDTATTTLQGSTADQLLVDDHMVPFQDLEWLLDPNYQPYDPFFNNGYAQIDQQVSIYDYELSGLL